MFFRTDIDKDRYEYYCKLCSYLNKYFSKHQILKPDKTLYPNGLLAIEKDDLPFMGILTSANMYIKMFVWNYDDRHKMRIDSTLTDIYNEFKNLKFISRKGTFKIPLRNISPGATNC